MKVPEYLNDKLSVILLNEDTLTNQSKYQVKNHIISLHSLDNVYLFVGDYVEKKLEINVLPDSDIQLYIIYKSSKPVEYDFHIRVHENAKLDVFTHFRNTEKVNISISRTIDVEENAFVSINNALLNMGGLELFDEINLNGLNAEVELDQLNIGAYDDLFIVKQNVKHNQKHTRSNINNSMISNLNSNLKYSVNGHIFKGNEYSSCNQSNKGIILNDKGIIEVIPQLYIDEYNVEASHGAAIGQVDEEQLYYLLSRGLTEQESRSLIISGYTKPFINKIQDEDIKNMVERQILKKINEVNIV